MGNRVEIAIKGTYLTSELLKFYSIFFYGINKKALRSISSWKMALGRKKQRGLCTGQSKVIQYFQYKTSSNSWRLCYTPLGTYPSHLLWRKLFIHSSTWKVKQKLYTPYIFHNPLLLSTEASNSTLGHIMTSVAVPKEKRPKKVSSQTSQTYIIPSLFLLNIITSYGFLIAVPFW